MGLRKSPILKETIISGTNQTQCCILDGEYWEGISSKEQ